MHIVSDNIVWAEMDGEAILLDTTSGEFYSLNETATEAWEGLTRGETIEQIAAAFADNYSVAPELAKTDVAELVAEFQRMGLLR